MHAKVVFFGPSEQLVANDEEIASKAREIAALTDCFACKALWLLPLIIGLILLALKLVKRKQHQKKEGRLEVIQR